MQEAKSTYCHGHAACEVEHDDIAEQELSLADVVGAWVCSIGVAAAVLLVVVVAAKG